MGDLLRLCHTVPLEVVSLGGLRLLYVTETQNILLAFILSERLHTYSESNTMVFFDIFRWKGLRSREGGLL